MGCPCVVAAAASCTGRHTVHTRPSRTVSAIAHAYGAPRPAPRVQRRAVFLQGTLVGAGALLGAPAGHAGEAAYDAFAVRSRTPVVLRRTAQQPAAPPAPSAAAPPTAPPTAAGWKLTPVKSFSGGLRRAERRRERQAAWARGTASTAQTTARRR
jgi:hypothetical protein